jgi:hypothetical protein
VGQRFTYTLTAAGSEPITYTTSALPAGLNFNSPRITGAPLISVTTPVALTATNGFGHDSQVLSINIQAALNLPDFGVYLPMLLK